MKELLLKRMFKLNQHLIFENLKFASSNRIYVQNSSIKQNLFFNNTNKAITCLKSKSSNIRYLASQTEPAHDFTLNNDQSDENKKFKLKAKILDQNEKLQSDNKIENVIDLNKDLKRKEIGFDTQSLLDNEWKALRVDFNKIPLNYAKLSKKNLTALVVATTMMGCVMAPVAFDPYIFFLTTLGTTLTSASANTFNQFLEVPYDSQMNRTKDRVLVRGDLTPLHAFTFASIAGISGVSMLYLCANPLTAALGASTLFLYTLIYTPMKRLSPLNTWVGSVVGAIPPLMGWTAMTGQIDSASLLLAAILYSWQFPHFHALSWNLRPEYSRAGYRMIAVLNPRVCTSSTLNHTLALTFMCCYLAPVLELTTWNFAIDSLPFNLYFVYLAYQFKMKSDAQTSRKVFRYSLLYLPFIILLMLITKYPIDSHTIKNDSTSLIKLLETRLENFNKRSNLNNINKSDKI